MAATRKPSLLLSMALCAALAASGCSAIVSLQARNAFDEMYLSVKHPADTSVSFGLMDPISNRGLIQDIWIKDRYFGIYRSALTEWEHLSITINLKDETISIHGRSEVADTRCLSFGYEYDFPSRTLYIMPVSLRTYGYKEMGVEFNIDDGEQLAAYFAEQGVTREDIERCRDYFLYDKVLTDWVTGNGERSRYSPGDFGDFDVIDDTFANLGEDWR